MPDGSSLPEIKISQLPVGTSANLTDQLEANQAGTSRSITVGQVATTVAGTLPAPPTTLPPSGAAAGDLAGTYPSPTVKGSVGLTGAPTAPTPATADSSTSIATTAFVKNQGYAVSGTLANYLPLAGGSMAAAAAIGWTGKSQLSSPADGNFLLGNNAGSGFSYLQFGGTTSAFPALFRSANQISVLLADGSNYATLNANNFNVQNGLFYGTHGSISSPGIDGQFTFFNNAGTAATRLDIATDGTIKFRNRTNTADAIATMATMPGTQNDNTAATTAFVKAAIASGASIVVGDTPPGSPGTNALWWNSTLGTLFLYYNDGNSTQWVPAAPAAATSWPGASSQQIFLTAGNLAVAIAPSFTALLTLGPLGAAGQLWKVSATVLMSDTVGAAFLAAAIFDGTSYLCANEVVNPATSQLVVIPLQALTTLTGPTTFTLRGSCGTSGGYAAVGLAANFGPLSGKSTMLMAERLS